jgi:hypothetical protein
MDGGDAIEWTWIEGGTRRRTKAANAWRRSVEDSGEARPCAVHDGDMEASKLVGRLWALNKQGRAIDC